MKKFLTIIALVAILAGGIFLLAGCGNAESKKYNGVTNGNSNKLENITESNYKDVAKEVYGVEISDHNGWTLKTAKSPNSVNNLTIEYTVNNGEDGKSIIESYFNKALALGNVYSYGYNDDYTAMIKGEQYSNFEEFAKKNLTSVYGLYQAIWLYEFNGKNIQFGIEIDDKTAGFSFVLLGQ